MAEEIASCHDSRAVDDCDNDFNIKKSDTQIPVILLDLETSGIEPDCDILQIATKCGEQSFSTYVTPVRSVSSKASLVNGLENRFGVLYSYGTEVSTVPTKIALRNLLDWFRSFQRKCCIAVHKLSFHGPRLHRVISECSMTAEFLDVIHGFVDTHQVIKEDKKFQKLPCSLEELAKTLQINVRGIHHAEKDCLILQDVLKALRIDNELLLNSSKTYTELARLWTEQEKTRKIFLTLKPLKSAVGESILQKLAKAGITMKKLQGIYDTSGSRGLQSFFEEKVENQEMNRLRGSSIDKILLWFNQNKEKVL